MIISRKIHRVAATASCAAVLGLVGVAGALPAAATTAAPASSQARAEVMSAAQPDFSKHDAVTWALANVNGSYNHFSDDCADFVSRALAQGGYPYSYVPSVVSTDSTNNHYWYYFTYKYGRWYSHSWSLAYDLAVHLTLMHSQRILNPANAQPGDVIFANWSNGNFAGISHVGIITAMSHGTPLITQHSPSQKNVSLTYWLAHPQHGGRVHVWIYAPNP